MRHWITLNEDTVVMLTLKEATQAFDESIKRIGLERFKMTSMFMSNDRQVSESFEKKAA